MDAHLSPSALLFLITGSRGAGKTSLCVRMVQSAREAGWQTAGLVSHAVFEGSQRVAIEAEDLRTGQVVHLATRSSTPTPGTKTWQFDQDALAWGSQVFSASTPVDLLVVDELGPLELERRSGWQTAIFAIDSRQYAIALVVIRSELLALALKRWPEANIIEVDTPEDSARKAEILASQLF